MNGTIAFILGIALVIALIVGCDNISNPIDSTYNNFTNQPPLFPSTDAAGSFIGVWTINETSGPWGIPIVPPRYVVMTPNSTGDWFVSSDRGNNLSRINWRGNMGDENWEFRFVDYDSGSYYYDWMTEELYCDTVSGSPLRCPYQVWNTGPDDDPSDDERIQIAIVDDDDSRGWSYGDRTYPFERAYFEPLPYLMEYTWDDDFHIGRIRFNDYSGVTQSPASGTVVFFDSYQPDQGADNFESHLILHE